MLSPRCNSKLLVVGIALLVYAGFITTKILSVNLSCRQSCVEPCEKTVQPRDIQIPPWERTMNFSGFNNQTGTKDGHYIIPNYVHFVKFGQHEFNFPHAVCVLAALKNQKPEKLFFHTDLDGFRGKYWDVLMNTTGFKEVLVIRKIKLPKEIFGQKLQTKWRNYHGGDIARLEVMMKYGGIYLDSDSYIVRSLNDFRRYEMSIGWQPGKVMQNQILVAHKDARFLRLWHESYRNNYDASLWYYNAGKFPTLILDQHPYLVHAVHQLFGGYGIRKKTYLTEFPEWRDYYALHLLTSHLKGLRDPEKKLKYPVVFNDENVLKYPIAFRDICMAVYPFPDSV